MRMRKFEGRQDDIRKTIIQINVEADIDTVDEVEIILRFPHPRYDRKIKVSPAAFILPLN